MRGVDHELRQRNADAVVNTLCKLNTVKCAKQIELSRTRPSAA